MAISKPSVLLTCLLATASALFAQGLDSLRETNRAAHDPSAKGTPFSLEAQVITICLADECKVINAEDSSDNGLLWDLTDCAYRSGDRIKAIGYIDPRADGHRTVCITNLTVLTHEPFPPAVECDGSRIISGEMRNRSVSVRGVIMKVMREDLYPEWNWILLKTHSGIICVSASEYEYPIAQLHTLIDAEVSLVGRAMKLGLWRKVNRSSLLLYGTDGIRTLRRAPPAPFDSPAIGNGDPRHRQKARGMIIARTHNRLFVSAETGAFLPMRLAEESVPVRSGDTIIAIGFVESDPFGLRMTEAIVRPSHDPSRESSTSDQSLQRITIGHLDTKNHGELVTLRGTIRSLPSSVHPFLTIGDGNQFVTADLSGIEAITNPDISTGAIIDLTGLCVAEFSDDGLGASFPRFHGFTIVPRATSDIRVVAPTPWWTPFRLLLVIIALFGVIVIVIIWNITLKTLSERRGRELFRENVAHISADLRTEERTRLAVDLHDSLAQMLTGVSFQIDAGELEIASKSLKSCRDELRNCLWDLRNQTLEQKDLCEAIRRTLKPHIGTAELLVRFNVPRQKLSDLTAHSVLMIIRELVTNAIRHGRAKTVRVAGGLDGDALMLSVRDDGTGFDPNNRPGMAEGHFGLQGIRERVKRCDGTMAIVSAPGKGTKVTISLKRQK